jgi:hypothetical protein
MLGGAIAASDDLPQNSMQLSKPFAHNRAAIGYLRTGNADLASRIDRREA